MLNFRPIAKVWNNLSTIWLNDYKENFTVLSVHLGSPFISLASFTLLFPMIQYYAQIYSYQTFAHLVGLNLKKIYW